MRTLLPLAATLAALLAACATNPVTGKSELSLYSESQEIAMGKQSAASVDQTVGLYPDSGVQRYVSALGHSLAAHTERPNLPWQFHVVDDPTVNAFALPGGFIFVTRGLLTHVNDEAELATVVGHECGHVAAKHSVNLMTQEELMTAGLAVGMAVNKTIARYGAYAQQGLQILFLQFSRDDEAQADQLGFKYALADSFDVRQMAPMFQMLDGITQMSGSRIPEWQSTHPLPKNRLAATQARVAQTNVDWTRLKVGRAEYLRMIDGMVYGDDPRNGYFEGTRFVAPALRFEMTFPPGWQTANRADAVLGASASGDAAIVLRTAPGNAQQAEQRFAQTQGLRTAAPSFGSVHGLPATSVDFQLAEQDTTQPPVRGRALFVQHGGATYQLLGYTTMDKWYLYEPAFTQALSSFAEVTDPKVLGVQPARVRVVTLPHAMTLAQFNAAYPSSIGLRELAVMNGLDSAAVIPAGTMVKRVVK